MACAPPTSYKYSRKTGTGSNQWPSPSITGCFKLACTSVAQCIIITAPLPCRFLYNRFTAEPSNALRCAGHCNPTLLCPLLYFLEFSAHRRIMDAQGTLVLGADIIFPE